MTAIAKRLLGALRGFFAWWLGELAALVPERLRRRLAPAIDMLVLLLGDGEAVLRREAGGAAQLLGRVDMRTAADPQHRLAAILRERGLARAFARGDIGVCLRLPADRAVRSTLELPLAAEENLDEVIAFELDRHTPFNARQACFAYRLLERDTAAQRLRLDLTVLPRATVDAALALAGRFRLAPDRLDIADAGGAAASGNLLPAGVPLSPQRVDLVTYGLAALVAVLAIVAVWLPLHAERRAAARLEQEFAAATDAAKTAAKLRGEIDDIRKDARFLIDRKEQTPSISKLLLESTRLLPDDTWISEWQLSGSEIQLTGFTRSASALVELLEQSRVFRGTTFRSPVMPDAKTGRERFSLAAQIVGKEKP